MQEHKMPYSASLQEQLRLQLCLVRAELRDRYEELEKKWAQLHSQLCVLELAEDESRREIAQTFRRLLNQFAKDRTVCVEASKQSDE